MPDLNYMFPAIDLKRGTHLFGVVHRERHRFLLINVLAGLDGVSEVFAMQVLRSGDQNSVDILVVEKAAMIEICFGSRDGLLSGFEAARVNVRKSDHFNTWDAHRLAVDFGAAVSGANQSHADAIVRAQYALWHGGNCCARQTGYFAQEFAA